MDMGHRNNNRHIPSEIIFTRLHARLCETGSLNKHVKRPGKPRIIMTPRVKEAIPQEVEDNSSTCTRKLSLQFHINQQSVWKALNANLVYPHRIQQM